MKKNGPTSISGWVSSSLDSFNASLHVLKHVVDSYFPFVLLAKQTSARACFILALPVAVYLPVELMTCCKKAVKNCRIVIFAVYFLSIKHAQTRLTALCPGLPGWAGTRKVKPIWGPIYKISYENAIAKVTIDLRQTSHPQNILRRTQGTILRYNPLAKSSEIVFVHSLTIFLREI